MINPELLLEDFLTVADIARIKINRDQVSVEILPAPHRPPSRLPAGKMAIYVFVYGDTTLKVGKAGSNSQARYISQHYNAGSSPSTLAASLLKRGGEIGVSNLDNDSVSEWIKSETDRINFVLDSEVGIDGLSLFESFLHCRLKPVFEGFSSQR
ncbi:hypothetical protein [Pseudidiomarina aestuarii]|uniref:hypothetical protein n=1 Tax=Pseudidiomarina aestuarii TaxID=624146 RepID=UPI003A97D34E